jgi:hypothetical protein
MQCTTGTTQAMHAATGLAVSRLTLPPPNEEAANKTTPKPIKAELNPQLHQDADQQSTTGLQLWR